jgi:hypothetical protein
MYNLRARFYDPAVGRFNQRDSLSGSAFDPQSLHKYLYASCDPVNRIDPSGHADLVDILITSAIIGGLAGMIVGGIRGGVRGAIIGLITGAIMAPLMTLATIGGGIGLAAGVNAIFGAGTLSATAGVTTAFAFVTAGNIALDTLRLLRNKNASTRERVADGVCLIFDIAGAAYGAYKLMEVPSLPPKGPSGGGLPVSKEQVGTVLSETAALGRAETVVAREVTIDTPSGVRVRVDLVVKNRITGALRFIESKFGPSADFTPNQEVGYPEIGRSGGRIVGPALEAEGLPDGSRIGPTDILVDWWE